MPWRVVRVCKHVCGPSAGTATTCALWQRASSMQTIRQLCDDAALLHHLFVSYDMKWEVKLSAVQKIAETFADIIQAALAVTPESPEEDVIAAVAALFAAEAAGEGETQRARRQRSCRGLVALPFQKSLHRHLVLGTLQASI